MNWNRSLGNWAELKGKAKKQIDRFKDSEFDFVDDHRYSFGKNQGVHKHIKKSADEHLDHLNGLLKNMRDYNSANSEMLKKEMQDHVIEDKLNG